MKRSSLFAALVCSALVATAPPALGRAGEAIFSLQDVAPSDSDGDGELDAAGTALALRGAKAADAPVEILSDRTESTSTFANADGTFSVTSFAVPIRVEQQGKWVDANYKLKRTDDGDFAPKAAPTDIRISGGGTTEAARVTFENGETLAVTWPRVLPAPQVSGATATFAVTASSDLIVTATASGVAAHLRLNAPPSDKDANFEFGLVTDGLNLTSSRGGLKLTDEATERVGVSSALVAWDSTKDEAGDRAEVVKLDSALSKPRKKGGLREQTLTLTPPSNFLTDPETVYPVFIDPDISALNLMRDTYTRAGETTPAGGLSHLMIGRQGGSSNTNPGRAFIQWENTLLAGKTVTAASMSFYQYYGGSCSPKAVNLHPLTVEFHETSTVDTNRPSVNTGTGDSTAFSTNRGPGCTDGAGFVTTSVLNMAKSWAKGPSNGGYTNWGVQLNVPSGDGSDATFERRFCSDEPSTDTSVACSSADRTPVMRFTYSDPAPSAPPTPTVTASGRDQIISTMVTGVPGGNVRARFVVKKGSTTVFNGYSAFVPSGSSASVLVPGLDDGTYTVQAWTNDGAVSSASASPDRSFEVGLVPFGKFVPMVSSELATTAGGPPLAGGSTTTLQVVGELGIPADATAIYASVKTAGANTNGNLTFTPAGSSNGADASFVPFKTGVNNQVTIPISIGANGQIVVTSQTPNSTVHASLDVEGYFTSLADEGSTFQPIPAASIYNSASTGGPLGAGETRTIQVAGVGGIPTTFGGGTALLDVEARGWTATGALTIYDGDDEERPETSIEFIQGAGDPTAGTNTTAAVELSMAGTVKVHNSSSSAINFALSSRGWFPEPELSVPDAPGFDVQPQGIQNASATRVHTFGLNLPAGYTLSMSGSPATPTVFDASGNRVGSFSPATAVDSNGVTTNGSWAISGNSVVQTSTVTASTSYPVGVAPTFIYEIGTD